jgi:integrase
LRLAREHLGSIKQQIAVGTFSFPNEFPDYRYLRRVVGTASIRSCNQVMDEFLAHCESRVSRNDMASVTVRSYRKVLDGVWRPALGKHLFHQVRYSHLVRASDWQHWSKKTYNNAISVIRRAFEFGYRDHPELPNPAAGLRTVRLKRQDRPKIDPFNIQDAETLISALHRDWGPTQGNYDEFRFFTGLRPSEQIALMLSDIDLKQGVVSVNKACVAGIDRDCTKTGEDRCVHRKPYCARHSSVSWNLMVGKNPLWVAKQHGHSVTTMFRVYAAWAEGAAPSKRIFRRLSVR